MNTTTKELANCYVQQHYTLADGWVTVGEDQDGDPVRWDRWADAQTDLDDHLAEIAELAEAGEMEPHDPNDWRVVWIDAAGQVQELAH